MNPTRNPRGIEWILFRDGLEERRIPFEEGVSPVFDIDARGRGSTFRIALCMGSERPPHPNVRITAEFISHSAAQAR